MKIFTQLVEDPVVELRELMVEIVTSKRISCPVISCLAYRNERFGPVSGDACLNKIITFGFTKLPHKSWIRNLGESNVIATNSENCKVRGRIAAHFRQLVLHHLIRDVTGA